MNDPLRVAIAATPLAAYLLLIGAINLRGRPLLVTGAGDLAAACAALLGVAFVGPIALFRPDAATTEFGDSVWLFLVALYLLWVTLLVMLCRPRLVFYNVAPEELRPVIADAARQLDPTARWAGEGVSLPAVGIQAHLDSAAWGRCTSLVASGARQDLQGWRRLSRALERSLPASATRQGWVGGWMLTAGVGLVALAAGAMVADPAAVATAWREMFSFGRG